MRTRALTPQHAETKRRNGLCVVVLHASAERALEQGAARRLSFEAFDRVMHWSVAVAAGARQAGLVLRNMPAPALTLGLRPAPDTAVRRSERERVRSAIFA